MTEKHTGRHRAGSWPTGRRVAAVLAATTIAGGSALILAAGASAAPQSANKIVLCHATDAQKNPYVTIIPASAGAAMAHYNHDKGPIWHQGISPKWGDIIPPFTYKGHTYSLNWTTQGMAIQANGCAIPQPAPSSSSASSSEASSSSAASSSAASSSEASSSEASSSEASSSSAASSSEVAPSSSSVDATSAAASSSSAPAKVDPTSAARSHGGGVDAAGGGGPIPAAAQAGLHAPTASSGMRELGALLLLFGGLSGLIVGAWPTSRIRRQH